MNITEAYADINRRNQLGSVWGLERIRELLNRLGQPQNSCRVVHIAGTNGKGSILACMDAVLQDAGYRVGKYISPTIFCYLERFQINGTYMEEAVFAQYYTRILSVVRDMEEEGKGQVTAFELETALAFLYFSECQVDILLLETGMGGRLDATNVVERPLCTILASISLDHMGVLGDTISAIAYEKTGILRDEVPCVVYPWNQEAMPVIEEQCELHKINPIIPDINALTVVQENLEYEIFDYKNVMYKLSLLGKHQVWNGITAIEALDILRLQGHIDFENVNIQNGFAKVLWQGRFEILEKNPYIIRDGAHNMDGARRLYEQVTKHFTNRRILYIIGVLADKEHKAMLSLLAPLADKIYVLTVPDTERALPGPELAKEVRDFCDDVTLAESPEQALWLARQEAGEEDVILAFGSLYYIGRIGEQNGANRRNYES